MLKKSKLIALSCLSLLVNFSGLQAHSDTSHSSEKQSVSKEGKEIPIDMEKLSEAFGNFIGRNLQSPGLKFDMDALIKGIREGTAGKASPLTDKEYEEMMAAVQEKAFKEMSATNLNAANEFLAKNSKSDGVKEIVAGKLQYMVLVPGNGPEVTEQSYPKIHYSGKYQDGTVFGSSEEMGGPITVPLNQTIPGFSKGIVGMKEGEKRRLFVHPDLGYGTTGQLPPNELLIFDIELVKANDEEKAKQVEDESSEDDEDDEDFYFEEEEFEVTPANEKAPSKN